jgi:hypothetical protein
VQGKPSGHQPPNNHPHPCPLTPPLQLLPLLPPLPPLPPLPCLTTLRCTPPRPAAGAAWYADKARQLDLADRYINSMAVKALFQAGQVGARPRYACGTGAPQQAGDPGCFLDEEHNLCV